MNLSYGGQTGSKRKFILKYLICITVSFFPVTAASEIETKICQVHWIRSLGVMAAKNWNCSTIEHLEDIKLGEDFYRVCFSIHEYLSSLDKRLARMPWLSVYTRFSGAIGNSSTSSYIYLQIAWTIMKYKDYIQLFTALKGNVHICMPVQNGDLAVPRTYQRYFPVTYRL